MPTINTIPSLFSSLLLAKVGILILLFMFALFTIVLLTQIKAMNRIVSHYTFSSFIEFIGLFYVLLAFSLFVLAIVIL